MWQRVHATLPIFYLSQGPRLLICAQNSDLLWVRVIFDKGSNLSIQINQLIRITSNWKILGSVTTKSQFQLLQHTLNVSNKFKSVSQHAAKRKLRSLNNFMLTKLWIVFFQAWVNQAFSLICVQFSGCNSKLIHSDVCHYRIIPDETPPLVLVVLLRLCGGFSKLKIKANCKHGLRCMRLPKKWSLTDPWLHHSVNWTTGLFWGDEIMQTC